MEPRGGGRLMEPGAAAARVPERPTARVSEGLTDVMEPERPTARVSEGLTDVMEPGSLTEPGSPGAREGLTDAAACFSGGFFPGYFFSSSFARSMWK